MTKPDILTRIDVDLRGHEDLELDVILDRVFPPGEQRNAPRYFDYEPAVYVEEGEPEWLVEWFGYSPMVAQYKLGSDREGEGSADGEDLLDDLYETCEPRYGLARLGRSPTRRESDRVYERLTDDDLPYISLYDPWDRIGSGSRWVGKLAVYHGHPRIIDLGWLAAEDRWLEDHSEP